MAGYAFRTFDERKKIEDLWEAGTPAKDIAAKLNISACGGASQSCGVMTAGAAGGLGCSPVPGRVANSAQS